MSMDDPLSTALLRTRRYFTPKKVSADLRTVHQVGGRAGDAFYRDRWSHDKVVRSTHGVNCTGSCSWKVYVKDGIITWEAQQTDYPSPGADKPDYEPRGCPRGAAFSWYTYSPTRVRYPYVRGVLAEMFRAAKVEHGGDPVAAWASIVEDPTKAQRYKKARGKGGLVRASWEDVVEIIAAAHVYTVKKFGPDRVAGFSPIPAMSMVSHAAGSRFVELIGGAMTSFYDWYADLPVASPQVFGDQTDVPESAELDGANAWQRFRNVTVPGIRSSIVVVVTTIAIAALKIYDIVAVMTGGRANTSVLAFEMVNQQQRFQSYGHAAALAVVLFIFVTPLIVFNIIQIRKQREIR